MVFSANEQGAVLSLYPTSRGQTPFLELALVKLYAKTMRLLQRSNTGEFSLTKDFVGDDTIPPYAILSHTWGADTEEVTFEDLTDGTGKDKPGYEKIRFCGEQARRDGLQYFWVDTCCIDKANDTELSQAINSMFRWYRNAAKCYVYLSDVSRPAFDTNDESNPAALGIGISEKQMVYSGLDTSRASCSRFG